jgi:NifB/MoaA-like Fe-S oxidoreductase
VYLSDEWYLRLDEKVPPAEHYDGFDLTENGVGLVRGFLEAGARRLRSRISELDSPTIATGTLFASVLRSAVVGLRADLVPVVNDFFGESVTVAGLLTAEDVITQLKDRDLGDTVVLPPPMFGGPEGQSVDDMWPGDVSDALGRPVIGRPAAESAVSGWPGHV